VYRERQSDAHPDLTVWTRTVSLHTASMHTTSIHTASIQTRSTRTPQTGTSRILPDGCLDVIWTGGALLVAGPDTRAHLFPDDAGAEYAGIRFAPGTGPVLLGIPACELRDQRVPLSAIWTEAETRRLEERVGAAGDQIDSVASVIEHAAVTRWRAADSADPVVRVVARGLAAGASVAQTARIVGLSDRQLYRRSLTAYGYGPKTLARILRFNRALDLARAGMPFADVATTAGYSDQAHLSREVRDFAGLSLSALLAPPTAPGDPQAPEVGA
jgi:AraC-like DNA-binding protein